MKTDNLKNLKDNKEIMKINEKYLFMPRDRIPENNEAQVVHGRLFVLGDICTVHVPGGDENADQVMDSAILFKLKKTGHGGVGEAGAQCVSTDLSTDLHENVPHHHHGQLVVVP